PRLAPTGFQTRSFGALAAGWRIARSRSCADLDGAPDCCLFHPRLRKSSPAKPGPSAGVGREPALGGEWPFVLATGQSRHDGAVVLTTAARRRVDSDTGGRER